MDWIIEKATELGVRMIQPIFSAKSLIKLDSERAERRRNHWQRIAIAACMQCGRDHIPDIAMPIALSHWLQKAPATPSAFLPSWLPHEAVPPGPPPDAALRLFLSPHQARPFSALPDLQPNIQSIWLLSGPEGGWSSAEQTAAHAAGWEAVQLGPRILRTETAGPAALAALQARWGDF
jgi:16S rRNA (uracil1498-N3)-methyltransferase